MDEAKRGVLIIDIFGDEPETSPITVHETPSKKEREKLVPLLPALQEIPITPPKEKQNPHEKYSNITIKDKKLPERPN